MPYGIPHTILFCVCKVVFIQSKAALGIEVNGCIGDISSMGGGDAGNDHHDRKAHGQNLFDRLHNIRLDIRGYRQLGGKYRFPAV